MLLLSNQRNVSLSEPETDSIQCSHLNVILAALEARDWPLLKNEGSRPPWCDFCGQLIGFWFFPFTSRFIYCATLYYTLLLQDSIQFNSILYASVSEIHCYNTRYSANHNLYRPSSRTNYGLSRFKAISSRTWETRTSNFWETRTSNFWLRLDCS